MFLLTISLIVFQGCGTQKSDVIYAGFVRSDQETQGNLRLAQNEVDVVVDGSDKVSKLTNTGNYFVIWVGDLLAAINALEENKQLKARIKELESAK